jgi:hypothetical protein
LGRTAVSPGRARIFDGQQRIAVHQKEAGVEQAAGFPQRSTGAQRPALARIAYAQAEPAAIAEIALDLVAQVAGEQQHVAQRLPLEKP